MHILVINGSPKGKNSNTYQLTSSFIEGINNDEPIEELDLNTLNIKPCLGCFCCWKKTPGKCVIQDDMRLVIEKILWADMIIWSFPLYYYHVPGPLKTMIDRQLPMVLPFMDNGSHPSRYETSQKRHILISTCGFYTTEGNYDAVLSSFDHIIGKNKYETLFCPQGELFRVPEMASHTKEYLKLVKKAGHEFINDKISEETKAKLNTPLLPKDTFESLANISWGIEQESQEELDDSLIFTKQMAALYNKNAHKGKDIVLEMNYTDIHKTYQIVLKKDGHEVLTNQFLPYTTKIETSYTLWRDIASDKISGEEALMKQMYKVKGNFDLMIHWEEYFGESKQIDVTPKTNMLNLLIPWIALWATSSAVPQYSGYISIALSALLPFILYRSKKTIYDQLSQVIVILLSIALLTTNKTHLVLSISYLIFGILWLGSTRFKIPLSAYYSANDYNGQKAFNNPLFMKTNEILTLLWGILYIVLGIFSLINSSSIFQIFNNIAPALMGIFTLWFQKWYPKTIAEGKKSTDE